MSILFATPAYGGQVTLAYFNSCLALQETLLSNQIDHSWLTTGNESLITRARNTSVSTFLKTEFEYLMFIDADIQFVPDDVAKLWNLAQENDVVCAAYPMKRKDSPLSAWKDGKLIELDQFSEPTPIDFAGTGFLMINRRVFEGMKEVCEEHEEGKVGRCWNFFDTEVNNDVYLSEDYNFCRKYRELGGEIILDPSIKLKHWGSWCYGGDNG